MVRRDAIRQNNGDAMLSLLKFHQHNHPKYRVLAHRLLAYAGGWLPPRLAEEVVWNRTVNLCGKRNTNLEMDLVNEFINGEFKGRWWERGGGILKVATPKLCS